MCLDRVKLLEWRIGLVPMHDWIVWRMCLLEEQVFGKSGDDLVDLLSRTENLESAVDAMETDLRSMGATRVTLLASCEAMEMELFGCIHDENPLVERIQIIKNKHSE